ncbi:MAG: hypothetical protein KKE39_05920 [Bacteroidetes bacterium]|nr:hypothetical protein [Bacteroidota bacterium]MBU1371386.1 hypothetical protein [Bacteroidota bacterium]MBU1485874.1 hypothetical protein [Bacteroidota bacterium]MBU1761461.1 hypothetical protein [Bacteroidota bacterium]MBU2375294.1 hypothetical protein [Bacteroidota bacterium]
MAKVYRFNHPLLSDIKRPVSRDLEEKPINLLHLLSFRNGEKQSAKVVQIRSIMDSAHTAWIVPQRFIELSRTNLLQALIFAQLFIKKKLKANRR